MKTGQQFERTLGDEFDDGVEMQRVVARQARDLADSGQFQRDTGRGLTVSVVVENLGDAPEELSLPERWNWWVGALEIAYGGYERFRIHRWAAAD